jgi:hypothetical protein
VVTVNDVDLAVVGAVRTSADQDRLLAWFRQIERLQQSAYIPLIRRFSDPPQLADVAALELSDEDLEGLRDCKPGRCGLKLAAFEMGQVAHAIDLAGRDWKRAAQQAFRQILVERARAYLAGGLAAALPYQDHRDGASPAIEFEALLSGRLVPGIATPELLDYIRAYPKSVRNDAECFLFWSQDMFGDAKPIVSITHVALFRGQTATEPTVVASVQVFATHYLTASLSLTAIVQTSAGGRYLVYARQSRADVFRGMFGGLVRRLVRKRLRVEGPPLLDALRRKLESGPPPNRKSQ